MVTSRAGQFSPLCRKKQAAEDSLLRSYWKARGFEPRRNAAESVAALAAEKCDYGTPAAVHQLRFYCEGVPNSGRVLGIAGRQLVRSNPPNPVNEYNGDVSPLAVFPRPYRCLFPYIRRYALLWLALQFPARARPLATSNESVTLLLLHLDLTGKNSIASTKLLG
jgi:hypothetical protein